MNRFRIFFIFIATCLVITLSSSVSYGADGSSLKPPAGARVAVVMFEDMECPKCAMDYPVVQEAAKRHSVPVVLHDFPLPMHPWSFDAAVYARYFDTKSEKLGDEFRGYIFQNQPQITKQNLLEYAQKFGAQNNAPLPFAVDPEGKLKDRINADRTLGTQIGLQHTPTIFVVGNGGAATPAVEVEDSAKLDEIITDMQKKAGPATKTAPRKGAAKKSTK